MRNLFLAIAIMDLMITGIALLASASFDAWGRAGLFPGTASLVGAAALAAAWLLWRAK